MVLDHLAEYESTYLACKTIGPKVGVGVESLRRWVVEAQAAGPGGEPSPTTSERTRIKELEREVRALQEANDILKAASIFFAGELCDADDHRVHRRSASVCSPDCCGLPGVGGARGGVLRPGISQGEDPSSRQPKPEDWHR